MASPSRTVKVKFDADATALAAAAKASEREIDKFSKSVDGKFRKSGDTSGKGFNAALKKWFSPAALGDIGQQGGTVFGSGFLGMLKTPVLGPAILAALLAATAFALPAVGAVAAGGLVAGFGAGLAGLGLVFAAKSQPVKDSWQKTLSAMGADMSKLSKPFEGTLISMAGIAQRTFAKFKPSLEAVFKELAPVVTSFVDSVGHSLEQLQPVIRPVSEAFSAVLDSLGPAIQSAIGDTSSGLVKLAESVKKNPEGLADMVSGVGDLTEELLGLVTSLNDAYAGMKNLVTQIPVLSGALTTNDKAVQEQGKHWFNMIPVIGAWAGMLGFGRGEVDKTTAAVAISTDTTKLWTQGLDANTAAAIGAGSAAGGATGPVQTLAEKIEAAGGKAAYAKQQFDGYLAALFKTQNLALGLSDAQINLQAAYDAATASVKENGRNTDINTKAGRANRTTLDNIAKSANVQTQAMLESGKGYDASGLAAEKSRANFVKTAQQMGYSKTAAEAMAKEMYAIPNVSREARLTANKADLDAKLKSARDELKDPDLTKERRAKLTADIASLLAQKKKAQDAIDALHGKTVTVTANIKLNAASIGKKVSDQLARSGYVEGRAVGGPVSAGRTYLVGENGPEVVTMGANGNVTPNHELGGPTYLETHIEIGGEVIRVVRSELKLQNRNLKRAVTAGVR